MLSIFCNWLRQNYFQCDPCLNNCYVAGVDQGKQAAAFHQLFVHSAIQVCWSDGLADQNNTHWTEIAGTM